MVYFKTSTKDDVKNASDIVELIGERVQLKQSGRNYIGLCPFHSEKTPSFIVNPVQQTFHCFGCKKGGDIFTFWMEINRATFPEALKYIAERYKIKLPDNIISHNERNETIKRNSLFEINEVAGRFFRKLLLDSRHGDKARIYLKNRGISSEEAVNLRLGYAPEGWDELCKTLKTANFSLETANHAGLVVKRNKGGFYDRFRDRIIFPLIDMKGQIVGFGGRVLNDSLPKYLNSPETAIFHKGNFLYGLNYSVDAIRQNNTVFVVEGYMDWLSMYLNGVKETVATLGTALTNWHIRTLKGFASNVVMVFDSDRAGISAILKSLPVFLSEGCQANVIMLPEHDPDIYIRSKGEHEFRSLFMQNSQPLIDFFIDRKLIESGSDIEGKAKVVAEIMPIIRVIDNNIRRSLYVQRIAERLKLSEKDIWFEFGNKSEVRTVGNMKHSDNPNRQSMSPATLYEKHILTIMAYYPDMIKKLIACNCRILISNSAALEIVDFFHRQLVTSGICDIEAAYNELKEDARCLLNEVRTSSYLKFNEAELKQALEDIEMRVNNDAISESIKGEKSLKNLNDLLELKRKISK